MDFFYIDKEEGHQEFVKTYRIGVGRKDSFSPSGSLTPLGTYKLGQKIAIYKPGVENYFQNKKDAYDRDIWKQDGFHFLKR